MSIANAVAQDRSARRQITEQQSLLNEQIEALVDRAPVMMHVVDQERQIVIVNQRWLIDMGYRKEEVIGRPWTEFLTFDSRARIIANVLPLCRLLGKIRSVGVDFVRKDSSVVHRLIDVDLDYTPGGRGYRYAAVFDTHQDRQWTQAEITMSAIAELIRIRSSFEGHVSYTPDFLLDSQESGMQQDPIPGEQLGQIRLTRKEQEVLARLAMGGTNAELAEYFSLKLNTVKFHIGNIFQKLDVKNRTQAVSVGRDQGLVL